MTTIVAPPWEEQPTGGGIADAPTDGKTYGRKDAAWAELVSAATAGDIVAASALPLPDVWAPLSDSLRMITGYGRDVLVGSDVVSRMVNFSRNSTATYISKDGQLKTAAVNEPRFEKEGLLIEGQSTNLAPASEGTVYVAGNSGFQTITNGVSGVLPVVGQRIAFAPNAGEVNVSLVQFSLLLQGGQTYTFSFFMKVEQGPTVQIPENSIGVYSYADTTIISRNVVRDFGNGVYRVALTFSVGGTGSQPVYLRFFRGGAASDSWVGVVGGSQVENLPFASSYIPTNGAAVTRAADYVAIPRDGNLPTDAFTFCVTVADYSTFDSTYRSVVFAPESSSVKERFYLSHGEDKKPILSIGRDTIKAPSANLLVKPIGVSVSIGGAAKLFCNGSVQVSASAIGAIALDTTLRIGGYKDMSQAGGLFGHVRNLRIWHRALTDDQIKAVA